MRRDLQKDDSVFPTELLPHLFDLLSDQFGAVRKFVAEILGEIGLKYVELIPEIVPLLIKSLEDETPAVARQVIACGADLFRSTLERVAVQGLHSSELNDLLESSWTWLIKFKDEICSVAFKVGINAFSNPPMGRLSYLIVFFLVTCILARK
jgi:symplekin